MKLKRDVKSIMVKTLQYPKNFEVPSFPDQDVFMVDMIVLGACVGPQLAMIVGCWSDGARFNDQYNSTGCQSCPAGRFNEETRHTACVDCPSGGEANNL